MKVAILDLGIGNIRSLVAALDYLGARHVVTDEPSALESATHAILPGVGAFDAAMKRIADRALLEPIQTYARENGMPILGVCLGMQLLCESSEEGVLPGLALMPGRFVKLVPDPLRGQKVPHVGFAPVRGYREAGLFASLGPVSHFYFTHSYALPALAEGGNVAVCDHGSSFVAAFQRGNVCGAQFHPEKSQSAGLRLIGNFLELG